LEPIDLAVVRKAFVLASTSPFSVTWSYQGVDSPVEAVAKFEVYTRAELALGVLVDDN